MKANVILHLFQGYAFCSSTCVVGCSLRAAFLLWPLRDRDLPRTLAIFGLCIEPMICTFASKKATQLLLSVQLQLSTRKKKFQSELRGQDSRVHERNGLCKVPFAF